MSDEIMTIKKKTVTNIADAIREVTGITQKLYPDSMPSYIRANQAGSSDTADIPEQVVTEAKRVASGMAAKRGANSLTAVIISDMHEFGDGDHDNATIIERYHRANCNAGQGAKVVAGNIDLDFFANLGDLTWGAKTSTVTDFAQGIVNARRYTYDVEKGHETFITPGNHDTATYGFAQNGEYLRQSVLDGLIGTYRYVDFDAKKVRVICLNTAEVDGMTVSGASGTERMTGAQLQWFADSLDLSDKSDTAGWGIVILSHHPLDWGNILPAANCLQAYLTGANYSVTHNGVAVVKNFSGKNAARVICQFHGHVHGFKVDYIRSGAVGSLTTTTVKRIAIPNACFARTNEYGENSALDSNGIEFGEATSYDKVDDGTARNTAFCLVSIDLDEQVIYADCYGAGYDRTISYGVEEVITYNVTNNLSNAANSNGTTIVTHGASYAAAITANSGYEMEKITVTMGGVDITASAVSGSNITISSVTGDIVITVTTVQAEVKPSYTNLVPTSTDASGNIYNSKGYQEGYRLNSSGTTTQATGAVNCGFIPYNVEAIRVYGSASESSANNSNYVALYDSSFAKLYVIAGGTTHFGNSWAELNGKYMLTLDPTACTNAAIKNHLASAAYIRCSMASCAGKDFVVTLDEPIE